MLVPVIVIAVVVAALLLLLLIVVLVRQSKSDTFQDDSRAASDAMGKGMGMGIAIGMGVGIAIGVALDNIGMGIAIGSGIGISMGIAFGTSFKKNAEEEQSLNTGRKHTYQENRNKKLPLIVGMVAVLIVLLFVSILFFLNMN